MLGTLPNKTLRLRPSKIMQPISFYKYKIINPFLVTTLPPQNQGGILNKLQNFFRKTISGQK